MSATLELLTTSRLKSWRKCRRHHKIRYIDGFAPVKDAEALRFGTLVHQGLETWWKTGDISAAVTSIVANAKLGEDAAAIKAIEIMRRYPDSWPDREFFDVLGVELHFETALLNPENMAASRTYRLGGKIDLLLQRKSDGAKILVEHKTTSADISDDGAHYFKKLSMDAQLSNYVVGCESMGHHIDLIIYDVLAVPQMDPLLATPVENRKYTKATASAPSRLYANQREADETLEDFRIRVRADIEERFARYFRRVEVVRLDGEIAEGMLDVWQDAKEMIAARAAGRAPRNPDACHTFGSCEFWEICALGIDPANSASFRRLRSVNPELAIDAQVAAPTTEVL